MLASAGPLPGGVSAMPIDAATFLQVIIPPVPSFAPAGTKISVTITARILAPDGTLSYCRWDNTFDVTVGLTFNSDLAPGYLLSVCATTTTAGVVDGAVYAIIGLTHQSNPGVPLDTLLVSSYISTYVPVGWPNGILRTLSDGNGFALTVVTALPAPGTNLNYTIVDQYVSLIGVNTGLITGVAVANRIVQLVVKPGGGQDTIIGQAVNAQAGSLDLVYYFGVGQPLYGAVGVSPQYVPFDPGMILRAGDVVRIAVQNKQAADQVYQSLIFGRAWI
jgi:hypothetical protein